MKKNLALIAKYFKNIYKPTNNNLRTSSNSRNKNVDTSLRYKNDNQTGQFGNQRTVTVAGARETVGSQVVQQTGIQCFNCKEFGHFAKECRKPKRVKDYTYHKKKMLMCKQAEKGGPLQAEQADWLEDTDEEIDKQELEAHYSYMAKIQEVPTADSGTDTEPLEQVQYDAKYNVFANERQHSEQPESISNTCVVEKVDSNVIPDSPNMCDNDIQTDQNAEECDDEHAALANLIANLTLDTEENKKILKQLKKANASLTQELKECKSNLEESNTTRDSCLISLQSKQTELETYKTLIDRTVDYDKLEHKLNETLGLLAQKEVDIKECLKLKAYEISVVKEKHVELVKQSFLTKSRYEGLVKEKTKVRQNAVQNDWNEVGQNAVQNPTPAKGNGNGINGNPIRCYNCRGEGYYASNCTVKPRKRDAAYLQTQLLIAQKDEAGIQLNYEEFDFMAAADAYDKIEKVNANCNLQDNLQQASTSGTQTDNAPVYDSDGSAEKAQQKQQSLYNGKVLLEKHDPPAVYDSEETLQLAQKSRLKMKQLNKEIKPENYTKINHLSGAKFVRDFKSLAKEADESIAKHKAFELEIKRLLRAVVSQDLCLLCNENEYAKLWNDWCKKCEECKYDKVSYDRAYNDMQQKIERLQAQLGDQDPRSQASGRILHVYQIPLILCLRNLRMKTNSEQKDTTRGTSMNTQFRKQSILGKPPSSSGSKLYSVTPFPKSKGLPKIDEAHALSKPVTSNSVPSPQESKVVKNNNVIAPRMFRINPFKTSRVDNFVPNKYVKASIRTKPITVSQPHVITQKDVNSVTNGFSPKNVESTTRTRRPQPRNNPKSDKYVNGMKSRKKNQSANVKKLKKSGSKESIASPSKPRTFLRWLPTGRMFDLKGKIIDTSESVCQSDCFEGDNACTSNPQEPISKRFPNSTLYDSVSNCPSAVTADASDKRHQQQDSTSSTSTLATTITTDGNFDL
ncbi:integrase, catalytic region, zinc finger, CCHC-type containing protein [Tanacetum coccineum]|uniref:Integrase, catalytic region, zinc finger, CCHC-type containing protein n=1 Tax=Tanacetum coccineum TaxID=301880 RepID=A0ABQ4XBF2_9ASTR